MVSTSSLWLHPDDPAPTATIALVTDGKLALIVRAAHSSDGLVLSGTRAQIAAVVAQLTAALAALEPAGVA